MAEKIPRRLKRFHRKGQRLRETVTEEGVAETLFAQMPKKPAAEEADKEITMHLTLEEVRKFKAEHKRYPKKQEYDQIAESIYLQLKDKERRERIYRKLERQRKKSGKRRKGKEKEEEPAQEAVEEPAAEEQKASLKEEEIKGLSVEDLFATEKKKGEKKEPGLELEEEFSLPELGEEKGEEKCPNCGKEGSNILFCPECGTAFCQQCAKGTEKIAGALQLVCPVCGKKVRQ